MPSYALRVNGTTRNVNVEPDTPLLYVLRNDLELNGPRFGCGLSQCGTCTVLVEGKPTRSCVMTMVALNNRPVTTLEGLGTAGKPHPLQKAFIEEQAAQCVYPAYPEALNAIVVPKEAGQPTRITLVRGDAGVRILRMD